MMRQRRLRWTEKKLVVIIIIIYSNIWSNGYGWFNSLVYLLFLRLLHLQSFLCVIIIIYFSVQVLLLGHWLQSSPPTMTHYTYTGGVITEDEKFVPSDNGKQESNRSRLMENQRILSTTQRWWQFFSLVFLAYKLINYAN